MPKLLIFIAVFGVIISFLALFGSLGLLGSVITLLLMVGIYAINALSYPGWQIHEALWYLFASDEDKRKHRAAIEAKPARKELAPEPEDVQETPSPPQPEPERPREPTAEQRVDEFIKRNKR